MMKEAVTVAVHCNMIVARRLDVVDLEKSKTNSTLFDTYKGTIAFGEVFLPVKMNPLRDNLSIVRSFIGEDYKMKFEIVFTIQADELEKLFKDRETILANL